MARMSVFATILLAVIANCPLARHLSGIEI
jgi:hypothetical protein